MLPNSDNRKRAFADVVTIDAWHDDFDDDRCRVDLHADVVFGTARVGGEAESPVRFRLSVKHAEVVVVIPDTEPVSVDRKSVSRDSPELEAHLTAIVEESSQLHGKGTVSASASSVALAASAAIEGGAQASRSASKKIEVSGAIQLMLVRQSKTAEGYYRWSIEPRAIKALEGRPWDAVKQPRLTLVDRRKDRSKGIPPSVRVEVRCRREDLSIDDLEIKDEGIWEAVKRRAGFRNRMAAAISYIRDHLSAEGLEVRNIEDAFGHVTLASVTAESF